MMFMVGWSGRKLAEGGGGVVVLAVILVKGGDGGGRWCVGRFRGRRREGGEIQKRWG